MLHDPEFWIAVSMLLLIVVIVWLKAPGLVNKALDEQSARIRDELEQAAKLHRDAKALLAEYQEKKRQVLAEAEQIVAHAQAEAERLAREAEADLTATLERRRKLAEAKIAQAEAQAIKDVQGAAVDLALAASRQLLAEQMKGPKGQTLLDDAIGGLASKLH